MSKINANLVEQILDHSDERRVRVQHEEMLEIEHIHRETSAQNARAESHGSFAVLLD